MSVYLSYLMAGEQIEDYELGGLDVQIKEKKSDGDRNLIIPEEGLEKYLELLKAKLENGFWNEMVCEKEIIFLFKFKDGHIKLLKLHENTEEEISKLCSEFSGDSLDKTENVYKYISGNSFYHDFMMEYYKTMINRNQDRFPPSRG